MTAIAKSLPARGASRRVWIPVGRIAVAIALWLLWEMGSIWMGREWLPTPSHRHVRGRSLQSATCSVAP